jgi:hypothetical protein
VVIAVVLYFAFRGSFRHEHQQRENPSTGSPSRDNSLNVHRQWLRRDSKATCVLFVSTASAAASFRSKCGSKRSPPECSSQSCPAAAPQFGQGTEDSCFGVRCFILIRICCDNTFRKSVPFGTVMSSPERELTDRNSRGDGANSNIMN